MNVKYVVICKGMLKVLIEEGVLSSYNIHLVFISILVAIFASYAAINLVSRIKAKTIIDMWLLLTSSILMGGGIWTMHFIGMLAFHEGISHRYDIGLTIVSFVLPIASSIISFWFIVWHSQRKHNVFLSSGIMGLGIAGMHYTGLESMEIPGEITYEPMLFIISILVGILASMLALFIFSRYRNGKITGKISSSIILGIAVSSMHYMGMSAAEITISGHEQTVPSPIDYSSYSTFIVASGLFFFLVLIVILITSVIDERYAWKLREREEQYRRLVELSPIGIAIHKFGVITFINPVGMTILGANSVEDLIGRNILDFIHPDYHEIVKARWLRIREQNKAETLEEKMVRLDKQVIDVEMTGLSITSNGDTLVQVFFQDISDRKKAEKMVHQLAYHDSLTKLPNRLLFLDRLNKTLKDKKTNYLAVMFIDLDGFKQVNDTLGHDIGDLVLVNVAERLSSCVRRADTVSRLAGDEFVILLPSTRQNDYVAVAQRIIEALREPMLINTNEIIVTPSIGISLSNNEMETAETLIKQADTAMYWAKEQGKNNYQIYTRY
ncbi:bifunctional diguanylate cyclase/phosphodiesterase [Bacillus sp. PS06]|uniref:sensor domain-containing diguanylate cyclase n=1 Tax=Bacillus sp. PS06 TaxID=2764176 RepID=UPI00177CAF0E|nr:diguanylate cyclase [Bacillus sp. PS06]MBD8071080.1 diguanylate cyclase [Bacillus sp. PS06]